jgi:hypothetical protein
MRKTKYLIDEVFSSADEKERRELFFEKLRQYIKTERENHDKTAP